MNWIEDETLPPVPETPVTPERRGATHTFLLALIAVALVLAVGGMGFYLGHVVTRNADNTTITANSANPFNGFGGFDDNPSGAVPSSPSSPLRTPSATSSAAARIAKGVDPSIVDINTNLTYQGASGAGTGVILSPNGLVVTNNHVISGATSITARDVATGKSYTATVVGYDTTKDVALLKLQNASGLTPAKLGDATTLAKGAYVVGIGNAGGVGGTPSYAAGNVSGLDQSLSATDENSPTGSEQLSGMIATSAAIQPGDSGGPLVNAKGQVVGIDTAGSSSGNFFFDPNAGFNGGAVPSATQGYAIPINTVMGVVKAIESGKTTGSVHVGSTAFLGVEVSTAAQNPLGGLGTGQPTATGAQIVSIIPNTPAAQTALVAGDVITALNGQAITSTSSLATVIQTLHAGDTVQVTYVDQNGTTATLSMKLAAGPAQ